MSSGIVITGENEFIRDVAWNEVGAGGQPAFGSGWSNYSSTFDSAAFRMDSEGWVHLKGLVKSATAINTNYLVFTLPFGWRPSRTYYGPCVISNFPGYVKVSTTGTVEVLSDAAGATYGYASLNNVKFPTWTSSSQFSEQYPLEITSLRNTGGEWPISLWKRKTGMVEVMGVAGAITAGISARVSAIAPNDASTLFPIVDSSANAKVAEIDAAFGFYVPGATTSYGICHTEYGQLDIESNWTTMAMSNSWVAYGYTTTGRWLGASYWKDPDGFVHLRGLVKSGSSATATIAQLPSGYRPAKQSLFLTASALATNGCRVDITPAGDIACVNGGSTTYTSLAGICFYADG